MDKATPRRLRHASGYLQLGLLQEAHRELASIPAPDRDAPPVIAVRMEWEMESRDWLAVIALASGLARAAPDQERAWICWGYALRELQRIEEARDVLLEAERVHGKTSAVLHYNLGCYYCLLGHLDTARDRLARAFALDASLNADALKDPDLARLNFG